MKTIKELQKERITCRAENKFRSQVLGGIIDGAKKIAKESNREVEETDIVLTCKRTVKALLKAHKDILANGGTYLTIPELAEYDMEIVICEGFLPQTLDENETSLLIKTIIEGIPEDQRNIGRVMGELKKEHKDSIDMGLASRLVKEGLLMEQTEEYLYKLWFTNNLIEDKLEPVIIVQPFKVLSEEPTKYKINAYGYESDIKRDRVNSLDDRVSWCTRSNMENFAIRMKEINVRELKDKIAGCEKRLEAVSNLNVEFMQDGELL